MVIWRHTKIQQSNKATPKPLDDYLIVAISSEGTVRNSAGDTIKMELLDIPSWCDL